MTAKLFAKAVGVAALLYLATGLYVVGGNEQALVVRFGKAQPELMTSGLHVDLPWPWTRVHRLRPQEMRTLVVGSTMSESESGDLRPFLKVIESQRLGDFFTGDKNVLHVQVHVQYRVVDAPRFLFDSESPEEGLRRLTEAALTETAAQCGVDFLHPLGAHERVIREILLERARPVAEDLWGLRIEDVTVTSVLPPLEVKSAFLDVSNARAERERIIHAEQTKAE